MKNYTRISKITIMILLLGVVVSGCSSNQNVKGSSPGVSMDMGSSPRNSGGIGDHTYMLTGNSSDFTKSEESAPQQHAKGNVPDLQPSKEKINPLEPKKVITTVQMTFETTEFDKTDSNLNEIIEKYSGYVENSSIGEDNYWGKNLRVSEYVIRIPKENVKNFKLDVIGVGKKINESTSQQDVTSQYKDTESRLKVITIKEGRILNLLEKAEKIEDIITLENQLSNTIQEKENLKSSLIGLDDKVDFSTFYIYISETEKLTVTETIETTFWTRIKSTVEETVYNFKKGVENSILVAIKLSPMLIIMALIGFGVYKKLRKYVNIKKERTEE